VKRHGSMLAAAGLAGMLLCVIGAAAQSTTTIATKPARGGGGTPNDWGVHDMQGNVSEWVGDWYEKDYFPTATAPAIDPTGPALSSVESRVIRGGSWGSDPRYCRVAARSGNNPWKQSASRGFAS